MRPVEKVADNDVNREIAALVFACHFQELFLVPVAQLALPETEAVLGHHGREAGGPGIVQADIRRLIPGGYPVVQLLGGIRMPDGAVIAEGNGADRRIVPEESVTAAGDVHGNAGLRIAVGELQIAALPVQALFLVLAHAVDMLAVFPLKGRRQRIVAAEVGLKFPCVEDECVFTVCFFQKDLIVLVDEGDVCLLLPSADFHLRGDLSAAHKGVGFIRHGGFHIRAGDRIQQGKAVVPHIAHQDGPHAQAVRSPGFNHQCFSAVAPDQLAPVCFKKLHNTSPFMCPGAVCQRPQGPDKCGCTYSTISSAPRCSKA